jgi:hypothetical protein
MITPMRPSAINCWAKAMLRAVIEPDSDVRLVRRGGHPLGLRRS